MDTPSDSKPAVEEAPKFPTPVEVPPVVRQQEIKLGRRTLKYTTVAGRMPLKNDAEEIEAQLYFTAYTLGHGEADRKRPLTIVFNGGAGVGLVWVFPAPPGPQPAKKKEEGGEPMTPPPLC